MLGLAKDVSTLNSCFFTDSWLDADDLGCFKFLEGAVNLSWVDAQLRCESMGGYLAETITTR